MQVINTTFVNDRLRRMMEYLRRLDCVLAFNKIQQGVTFGAPMLIVVYVYAIVS